MEAGVRRGLPFFDGGEHVLKIATVIAAAAGLLAALPASADTDKTPPGNPCAKGNGNPCNGNNGNPGHQGNGGGNGHTTPAPPFTIPRPAVIDRHVFITQIGRDNRATVRQTAPNAYAKVDQDGDDNIATIAQNGSASGYVELLQRGTANDAAIGQSGTSTGNNTLYATQLGTANLLRVDQTAQAGGNGAILLQDGGMNRITLGQAGSDNMAKLSQDGDRNAMTADQTGTGNRLIWTQTGNGLSDLAIKQTGGQSVMITQTR